MILPSKTRGPIAIGARALVCIAAIVLTGSLSKLQAQETSLTFNEVVKYLDLEVKEERLLKMVNESSTIFTLGQDQIKVLKAKGASDRLIEAILQKGKGLEKSLGPEASDISDYVLILDCSGSMRDQTSDGKTKFDVAQKAAIDLIAAVPNGKQLAFVAYGHQKRLGCRSVEIMRPLSPITDRSRAALTQIVNELQPVGNTPIAYALQQAGKELERSNGLSKLVLITDGMETCGGHPVTVAKQLAANKRLKGGVNVIGFDLKAREAAAVAQIAAAGNGQFYDAKNAAALSQIIESVSTTLTATPAQATTTQGSKVTFPAGDISWADAVVSFKPGEPGPKKSFDPKAALGKPDYTGADDAQDETHYVALGDGGELVLEFSDNILIDGPGPDLAIFEIGPQVEPILVAISEDGKNWIDVGRAEGSKCSIDIAPFVKPGQRFHFVKLTDAKGGKSSNSDWPGADIDAVGAINTLAARSIVKAEANMPQPTPVVATTTQGDKILFAGGDTSWADAVVSFKPGDPGPKKSFDPKAALGKPDFSGPDDAEDQVHYVALGDGGELVLQFTDNVLIDGPGPDLAIFEIGPQVEPMLVAISEDGKNWIDVGRAEGSKCSIDIAPFVKPGQRFRFVKLTDAKGGKSNNSDWPGADIDAVGAINSAPVRAAK